MGSTDTPSDVSVDDIRRAREADESILARWTGGGSGDLERMGLSPEELMRSTREHVRTSRVDALTLVDWFVDEVAGR